LSRTFEVGEVYSNQNAHCVEFFEVQQANKIIIIILELKKWVNRKKVALCGKP